jgi:dinuclear metal center YbgI/SA1388 family protein
MSIHQQQLSEYFQNLFNSASFNDYCPNGLQIEGCEQINKIAFAVSATKDSITKAIAQQADTLVVHHGLFWKFHGTRTLTGAFGRRVFPLVKNNINLFAYHLPLDAHSVIGNAATLGNKLGLQQQQPFGDYKGSPTGIKGLFTKPILAEQLANKLESILQHTIILASPDDQRLISSIGIITGGANSHWNLAVQDGLDAYLTGEISEHDWHESQENNIHMFAGGHHATERFGIQALMQKTQEQFAIDCVYIDSDNPA